ncbi:MAG: CpsB/CapC family capsule biosynthesis tyrosine phosphatase [Anaerovoracaceae bacterium]
MDILLRTDFHTHILPQMDDGSSSAEESLAMLREEKRQGVESLVLTPHFYPAKMDPQQFLQRRERSWETLQSALAEPQAPEMILGAEVHYFEGIARTDGLSDMHLGNSRFLLLEMPFTRWTDRMITDVIELHHRADTRVILAHMERYLKFQHQDVWDTLRAQGILLQANASFFLDFRTRRKAVTLLKREYIHVLGSDCHNMDSRPPRMEEARNRIREAADRQLAEGLAGREQKLMEMMRER